MPEKKYVCKYCGVEIQELITVADNILRWYDLERGTYFCPLNMENGIHVSMVKLQDHEASQIVDVQPIPSTKKPVDMSEKENDPVNHPSHYTAYPGIEIIQLTRHMNFNRGNSVKY